MEELKQLLGDEMYNQVIAKLGNEKYVFGKEDAFVAKSELTNVQSTIADLQKTIADRDTQLTELSKSAKGNPDLQKKFDEEIAKNKQLTTDYEAKLLARDKDYAIDRHLMTVGAKNLKATKALLNVDNIGYKDGRLEGIEAQIKELQAGNDSAFLFGTQTNFKTGPEVNPPNGMTSIDQWRQAYSDIEGGK